MEPIRYVLKACQAQTNDTGTKDGWAEMVVTTCYVSANLRMLSGHASQSFVKVESCACEGLS